MGHFGKDCAGRGGLSRSLYRASDASGEFVGYVYCDEEA